MLPVLLPVIGFPKQGGPTTLADLERLVQRRDVAGLTALTALPTGVRNPFRVLQTGGAYGVGSRGWHVEELADAAGGGGYFVIWTPLTSEDIGEIVVRKGAKLQYIPESDPLGTRIVGHKFDLRFDVPNKKAYLVDRMRVAYAQGAPSSFLFRMSPCYVVREIRDGRGRQVPFYESGGVVSVKRSSQKEEEMTVRYDAVVDLPDYAASISEREATLVNDYWYPMIARGPAPYDVTIRAPRGWVSVAQGDQVFDRIEGDQQVTGYSMALPVTYYSLISAPFREVVGMFNRKVIHAWSTRATVEQMKIQDQLYGDIFNYYAAIFGPPPYPRYGYVDSLTYGGGALEAYTFATWGGGMPHEDAHEPAHTWWGGIVDNTYLNSFWNESFADFSEGLYRRNVPIGKVLERRLAFIEDGNASPDYRQAAMADSGADIGPVGSSLGYGKGAKVLQMLEQIIGTNRMIFAMHTWAATQPKGVPGNWEDFERIVERLNPAFDLKPFFDDWLRRPGYADFDADVHFGDQAVDVNLKWQGTPFCMPIGVMVEYGDGWRQFVTAYLRPKPLSADPGKPQVISASFDRISIPIVAGHGRPALCSVDPYRQALRRIAGNERPTELGSAVGDLDKLVDPAHLDWLTRLGGSGGTAQGVTDFAGKFVVGSPETLPTMAPLCQKAGFDVHGDKLTYDGTTIDLKNGCALAVVDLGDGKRCVIGLGKTKLAPNFGRSRLILTDELGRFLRGVTDPKTTGKLTFRAP